MTPLQLGFYERLLTILRQLRRPRRQSRMGWTRHKLV